MMEAHVPSGAELFPGPSSGPNPAAAPSLEGSGARERIEALLRQVHEQRVYIQRLHHANVEANARTAAATEKAQAEVKAMQTEVWENQKCATLLREQSRHHQEQIVLLQSQIDQVYRENYELKLQLSALRYRVANKVVRLIQKVPGLESVLRKALRLPRTLPAP